MSVPRWLSGRLLRSSNFSFHCFLSGTAFADSTVRAVSVPDCVERIEKGAFAGCDNISTLRLPFVGDGGEINHFGHIFGSDSYENHAIKVPASLDMVILGDKTEEIAENAFAGCKSVSAIALPESVESIGAFAFYECKDLVYITSLNSVKGVGSYAFGYCSSLVEADFSAAESFDIGAFYECNSLHKLVLPFVGGSAEDNRFIGYVFGAESADYNDDFVPESLYEIKLSDACSEIPDRAFADCPYIANFIVPESVEKIGARAFYSCRSIQAIELPNALKTIGDDAFFGCDNLKSIEFGDGVESIGMQAFYGCRALEAVEIPEKITEIMPSTFALCESLKSVSLNNVKKVGKDAFWGCSSLTAVDCSGIDVAEGNSKLVLTPNDDE